MIPIILIALGIGAIATYEMSSKAKGWVDEHVKAIEDAFVAHRVADEHLKLAQVPVAHPSDAWSPLQRIKRTWEAAQHAQAATVANKVAAQKTAQAAQTARTEPERQNVVQSAAAVADRQEKIAIALQQLGTGQCGVRSYPKVAARIKDALIAKLKGAGMDVTGNNPWDIDSHKHDVKLRALWDPSTEVLHLIVTAGEGGLWGLVSCDKIWEEIEPILKGIIG